MKDEEMMFENTIPPEAGLGIGIDGQPIAPQPIQQPEVEEEPSIDMSSYTVDADFNDEQETRVMSLIKGEMARIQQEYEETGYLTKCEAADDEYNGLHDEEVDADDPDIKLLLTTITIDIIASRAYRQTWTPSPCVIMEAKYRVEDKGQDVLFKRQDALDYYLRNESKLQDISLPLYRAVLKYGVAPLKTCLDHQEETRKFKKFYRAGNQKDIDAFFKKYGKKLLNPDSKESKEYEQLVKGGKPVAKIEDQETINYHGAKHYRVDWKRFFARPSIKDFNKHIVKSEMFTYNWYEIEQRRGFWDSDKIDEILADNQSDYDMKDYDFYETEVMFSRNDDGKQARYIVTYESQTEKIVRAKYSPYKKTMYEPYVVFERDDTWIGDSLTDRMADIVATANSTINSFVGEQALAHTPIIIANGRKTGDWTITLGKPNLLPMDSSNLTGGQVGFAQYRMESPSTDRIAFLQWILMYVAILSGIDLVTSAGASDPQEKNPTNYRTQAKMVASTIRVEDMILTLQKSESVVAEQTEDIIANFPLDYSKNEYSWVSGGEEGKLDRTVYSQPVRYVMAGSRMSFDRSMDLQVIMQTIDFLAKYFPESFKDLAVRKALLIGLLNNTQGTIEKIKDTIVKPFDDMIKVSQEGKDQLGKIVADARAQGVPEEQIQGFIRQLMAGGQANPAGMPSRPPQMPGNAPNTAAPPATPAPGRVI